LRFLTDVNASGALAGWLEALRHDVARVSQRDPKLSDDEILRWAVEEGRIVVTTDKDFEEMIWRGGRDHRGVLRLENLPRAQRRDLLLDILDRHGEDLERGAIVIATRRTVRVRRPW
jgi:predicted nuclease of predicted toxin-antitoxin system